MRTGLLGLMALAMCAGCGKEAEPENLAPRVTAKPISLIRPHSKSPASATFAESTSPVSSAARGGPTQARDAAPDAVAAPRPRAAVSDTRVRPDSTPPPPVSAVLSARVEAMLEIQREGYAEKIEQQSTDLAHLEADLSTKEQLIEVVRQGGRAAQDVMRQFPAARTRSEWLSIARRQVDDLREVVSRKRADLQHDSELAEQGLYPPPPLALGRHVTGDFGFLHATGPISRVLEDGSFVARFAGQDVHCQGFDVGEISTGRSVSLAAMCLVRGSHSETSGARGRRSIPSLGPLDPAVLPDGYRESLARRRQLLAARLQDRLDKWQARIEHNRDVIRQRGGLPKLGTRFEPQTLIDIILGEKAPTAPQLPRRYRTETVSISFPHVTPTGISYAQGVKTRRVETDESKRWRAEQAAQFKAIRDVYPAYSLDDFIKELGERAGDPDLIHNHESRLGQDIDSLVQFAFTEYRANDDRVREIPWSTESKQKITGQLREMAIRYGEFDDAPLDEATGDESQSSEIAAGETAANDAAGGAAGETSECGAAAGENADVDPKQEQRAAARLKLAKRFVAAGRPARGKEDEARRWLSDIVNEFPGTAAATEAQKLLDGFP